ncbi:substrate-binding periplasmic protein [Pseudoalteromonas shioyasakiensis]|uniref:substrate-binding periplasmic protein n=1 Tax=Pseudoalteromonas shioyasakiensis TaxID=1190813 RepID=UPI000782A63B|nr:transporter substrate-binding domain-containing protein [Pseudoalteromonas shioyasakiensis]
MKRLCSAILVLLSLGYSLTTEANNVVNLAIEQRPLYKRDYYLHELLAAALRASNYQAEINEVLVHPHQQRTLLMLDEKQADVFWSMTSPEREHLAIAVKVPLFKGYIGKRALLTKRAFLPRFKDLKTKQDLAQFSAIQGHDWPDTKILAQNGLTVRPLANYRAMFSLVIRGRVDYFPRSFIEVISEMEQIKSDDLAIVPDLYISYPTAFYFFVSNHKPELAEALLKGLKVMKSTGEFEQLFASYFAEDLAKLPFKEGEVIEIKLDNDYFQPQKKEL